MLAAIRSIPRTFYSRPFYADLILKGKGIGLGFVIIYLFFSFVVPMALEIPSIPLIREEIVSFFSRLPGIRVEVFKDGGRKLSIDQPSPYSVTFPSQERDVDKITVKFDMDYRMTDVSALERDMKDQKIDFLITSDFMASLKENGSVAVRSIGDLHEESFSINHERWVNFGQKIATWFPLFFVVALIPLFLATLVIVFLKAIVVKLLALFFSARPDFSGAMRLAGAASVPVVILGGLAELSEAAVRGVSAGRPWLFFLLWVGMAIYGLAAANQKGRLNGA